MLRATLRSVALLLAVASCEKEPVVRPGVSLADAALSLSDLGAVDTDLGPLVIPDGGSAHDTGVAPTDTGVAQTDMGVAQTDTGAVQADTGVAQADTGGAPTDTESVQTDTGSVQTDTGAASGDGGACAVGLTACGAPGGPVECVSLTVSTLHCGGCGNHCCGSADRCVAGVCTSRCPTLWVSCPSTAAVDAGCIETRCVDVSVDDLNCGACGNACPDGKGCVSGHCI